jgi:hypothetical protein
LNRENPLAPFTLSLSKVLQSFAKLSANGEFSNEQSRLNASRTFQDPLDKWMRLGAAITNGIVHFMDAFAATQSAQLRHQAEVNI